MLNRRTFTAAAALGAAAIGAPLVHGQAKLEKSKVSIAVGGKAAFYYLPLTISEQLGYFKAEGLDVEILDFPGGAKALQALIGGSVDVVSGAYEHTITQQAKGQNVHQRSFAGEGVRVLRLAVDRRSTRGRRLASISDRPPNEQNHRVCESVLGRFSGPRESGRAVPVPLWRRA